MFQADGNGDMLPEHGNGRRGELSDDTNLADLLVQYSAVLYLDAWERVADSDWTRLREKREKGN
jgi:hypothetical protein